MRSAYPPTSDIIGIGGIRIERRIEIDQINALGRDAVAENLEVVAVVEGLHRASPLTSWPVPIIPAPPTSTSAAPLNPGL